MTDYQFQMLLDTVAKLRRQVVEKRKELATAMDALKRAPAQEGE
ncbi:hypothetical protein [Pseudomonas syringae]|nr:hypothetical protein [Pseudomonas syringae]